MLNGLDLFSGIGGLTLALGDWVKPAAYCENDRYAQGVLLSRMRSGDVPLAPIWDDVTTLTKEALPISPDIIYGGFPCQDISVAGNGVGIQGKRSGLFFEIVRLIKECEPTFIFLENVPAIRTRGAERVGQELSSIGYDCRWTTLSAKEVGAPHVRNRWFMLAANPHSIGLWNGWERKSEGQTETNHLSEHNGGEKYVAESNGKRLERWVDAKATWEAFAFGSGSGSAAWPSRLPKPALCRGDDGLRHRVERLRGLGNAVVPLQAREAFRSLVGI